MAVLTSFTTSVRRASLDEEGLFHIVVDGKAVLWIPSQAMDLQVRLMVFVYMQKGGHRGVTETLQRLMEYCYWSRMDARATKFVHQCSYCVDSKVGEMVPRPLGKTVHGMKPEEVLHFDSLYVGDSGPLGADGLHEGEGFKYFLVMVDELSNSCG